MKAVKPIQFGKTTEKRTYECSIIAGSYMGTLTADSESDLEFLKAQAEANHAKAWDKCKDWKVGDEGFVLIDQQLYTCKVKGFVYSGDERTMLSGVYLITLEVSHPDGSTFPKQAMAGWPGTCRLEKTKEAFFEAAK